LAAKHNSMAVCKSPIGLNSWQVLLREDPGSIEFAVIGIAAR